jgi:hypothetical protein
MPGASLRRGAVLALLVRAGCDRTINRLDVQGTDRFGENTLDVYTAYPQTNHGWNITGGQLVGTGPATNSLLLWNGVAFATGGVEVITSRADDGGLVLRAVDQFNYMLLELRDDGAPAGGGAKNLAIIRVVGGARNELWSTDLTWPRGSTHTIRFEAQGAALRAFFDGVQVGEANDPSAGANGGQFGMRHNGVNSTWITAYDEFHWNVPVR